MKPTSKPSSKPSAKPKATSPKIPKPKLIATKFSRIAALLPDQRRELYKLIWDEKSVTKAADFLIKCGLPLKKGSASTLIHTFRKEAPTFQDFDKFLLDDFQADPTSLANAIKMSASMDVFQKPEVKLMTASMQEAEFLLEATVAKTKELIKCSRTMNLLQEEVKQIDVLQEMQRLVMIQYERVLKYLDMENNLDEKGKPKLMRDTMWNMETLMQFLEKTAKLQLEVGVIERKDKEDHKHLHINVTQEQQDLIKRFNEQQQLGDLSFRAMEVILDANGDTSGERVVRGTVVENGEL